MPRRTSLLTSRISTAQAPSEIAASVTSITTPLISTEQGESTIAATSSEDKLAAVRKIVLPAGCVARPVSRWYGPFRRNYPQHHIYRGLKYWEKGFEEIQFVVDNFVDWREKEEVQELVTNGATFVKDLAEIRQRLNLEECRDWKRDVRTFMVKAESSSRQAQAQSLLKKLNILSVAAKRSSSSAKSGGTTSSDSKRTSRLRNLVKIEPSTPVCGPSMLPSGIIDSEDPFADGDSSTPKVTTASLSQQPETIEQDDDAQPDPASDAAGESIEMAVFNATAMWVQETVAAQNEASQRPRALRRVSSLPNI